MAKQNRRLDNTLMVDVLMSGHHRSELDDVKGYTSSNSTGTSILFWVKNTVPQIV
jgi:hypothetical protein